MITVQLLVGDGVAIFVGISIVPTNFSTKYLMLLWGLGLWQKQLSRNYLMFLDYFSHLMGVFILALALFYSPPFHLCLFPMHLSPHGPCSCLWSWPVSVNEHS